MVKALVVAVRIPVEVIVPLLKPVMTVLTRRSLESIYVIEPNVVQLQEVIVVVAAELYVLFVMQQIVMMTAACPRVFLDSRQSGTA